MPIRDLLIEQSSSAIIEPISQQMTYDILRRLGLGGAFNDNIYVTNEYTKPSFTTSGDSNNALISQDRCDVKVVVAWNPTETKWNVDTFKYTQAYGVFSTLDRALTPVFADPVAGIQLTEHQMPCSMSLEFSLQFKNRESAFSTISVINNTSMKDSVINEHILSYSYPISKDMLQSLYTLYLLRLPTVKLDFWSYLKHYSKGATQYIQRRTGGTEIELIVKRQDIRAIGVLEYNQTAPGVQEQDRGIDRFTVEFTYTIQFARPDVMRLNFPVVVGNKPVPSRLIRHNVLEPVELLTSGLQERSINSYLRTQTTPASIVVRRPIYDDFRPPQQPVGAAGFAEFLVMALYLDDTPTTTIDLLNLGSKLHLHDTVVTIMKLHGRDIFTTTGLFNVTIYCNGIPVDLSRLAIDDNLIITLAMSHQNRRYHVVISEATDLRSLDGKWYQTFITYRSFFPMTLMRNIQRLIDKKYCYIDRDNKVLQFINWAINQLFIDKQIAVLITAGHLNHYAYSYATTAEQFVAYLIHIKSPVSHRSVYDEYVQLCIDTGMLLKEQLTSGQLQTPNGIPVMPGLLRGTPSLFNLPLRVIMDTINIPNTTSS